MWATGANCVTPGGKLVTEIVYLQRKGKREPISIEQHVFKYHITIQYLGD